jgi:hypothetical protein
MEERDFEEFMVFELEDSGERKKIKDISPSDIKSRLHSKQVLIIVRQDLKRVFIFKGSASPVKKRFISSRAAIAIRERLNVLCKIVSVDQGDEPLEFLNAFNLESMPVTETLADLRYERKLNIPPEIIELGSKIKEPSRIKDDSGKKEEKIKDGKSAKISKKVKSQIYKKIKVINGLLEDITDLLEKN